MSLEQRWGHDHRAMGYLASSGALSFGGKITACPFSTAAAVTASSTNVPHMHPDDQDTSHADIIHSPRLWHDVGWTASIIKNEDDDGWAVAMFKDGQAEPALVGPWTMGRDKKNPKPLDTGAFNTLVKTASEVLRRHEQQRHAQLHKRTTVSTSSGDYEVTLDIVPDEYEPYATLSAFDRFGETVASVKVAPNFKLNQTSAAAWVDNEFRRLQ